MSSCWKIYHFVKKISFYYRKLGQYPHKQILQLNLYLFCLILSIENILKTCVITLLKSLVYYRIKLTRNIGKSAYKWFELSWSAVRSSQLAIRIANCKLVCSSQFVVCNSNCELQTGMQFAIQISMCSLTNTSDNDVFYKLKAIPLKLCFTRFELRTANLSAVRSSRFELRTLN